jgi:hypothetical protein
MKHLCLCLVLLNVVLIPCATQAGQQGDPSKPAYIGVVHYIDHSATLIALDRQVPRPKANIKMLGFGGARALIELDGEKASLRLLSNKELSFVVELASGVDPREFQLYPFAVKNGKRQRMISSTSVIGKGQIGLPLQVNISRYGENSYRLTPSSKLAIGEYAFMAGGSIEVFCFGVDRQE